MTFLSLKGILLHHLYVALLSEYEARPGSFTSFSQKPGNKPGLFAGLLNPIGSLNSDHHAADWLKIPLEKKSKGEAVLYLCALPQKLAKSPDWPRPSPGINFSEELVNRLNKAQLITSRRDEDHMPLDFALVTQLWLEFKIETQRPGWVTFRLSEIGIAQWLGQIHQNFRGDRKQSSSASNLSIAQSFTTAFSSPLASVKNPPKYQQSNSADRNHQEHEKIWQLQYSHARCCRLLAHWKTCCQQTSFAANSMGCANSIEFWLTNTGQIRLQHQAACQLIHALIEIADDMFWIPYRWPSQQYFLLLKRSTQLCQSFDLFCRACLSGFSQTPGPVSQGEEALSYQLFQARFGLVSVTRNMLEALLVNCFDAVAPRSL